MQSSQQTRVLLYSREFPPFKGGAGHYCAHLAGALASRNLSVRVLAPDYPALPMEALPIKTVAVSRFSRSSALRNAWSLLWIVLRYRINHVIIGDAGALADFIEVPSPDFVRYSVVTHGTEILNYLHPLRSRLDPVGRERLVRLISGAQSIIHSSEASRRLIEECGLNNQNFLLVYPVVEAANLTSPTPELMTELRQRYDLKDEPVILSVSRLDLDKGQDVLLKAFSRVLIVHPGVKLIIGGEGPLQDSLTQLAHSLGIEKSVLFAGPIPSVELAAHHQLSSFFVMASRSVERFEGFGIVFLEAALCQRTAVAGNQGGVPEAVEDGVTGLLVDPTEIEAVAEAILKLLDDPVYRGVLAKNAFERASTRFNLQTMARQLLDRGEFTTRPYPKLAEKALGVANWSVRLIVISLRRLPHAVRTILIKGWDVRPKCGE